MSTSNKQKRLTVTEKLESLNKAEEGIFNAKIAEKLGVNVELSNVGVIFLPKNTTCQLQAPNMGVIRCMKVHFRRRFTDTGAVEKRFR